MKFLNFLKRHIFFTIATIICLIIFIVGIVLVKKYFFVNNGNEFGNRLDGIEENRITDEQLSKIVEELKNIEQITSASYNVVGRRANFTYKVVNGIDKETARTYTGKILELLDDNQKKYYDIEVMIESENQEDGNFPTIGYKHKSSEGFSW